MERGERYDLERRNPNRGFFFARSPVLQQQSSRHMRQEQEQEHQIGSAPQRRSATLERDRSQGQRGTTAPPPTHTRP